MQTKILVKHYLEQGVSKPELGQQFQLSWRALVNWIELCELDRHLGEGAAASGGGASAGSGQRNRRGAVQGVCSWAPTPASSHELAIDWREVRKSQVFIAPAPLRETQTTQSPFY